MRGAMRFIIPGARAALGVMVPLGPGGVNIRPQFAFGSFISNVVATGSGDGTDEERGGRREAEADGDDEGVGGEFHGDAVVSICYCIEK
mmetsp:Transcript_25357/g.55402  ORF Transcript_25357/g.55402 Transcript_25357/m.55402 type:complete len:89 (+) Transcript_25357:973-1239(+)